MILKDKKQVIILVFILFVVCGLFAWFLHKANKEELESIKNQQDENIKNDMTLTQEQKKLESDIIQLGYILMKHNEALTTMNSQNFNDPERKPIGFKQNVEVDQES